VEVVLEDLDAVDRVRVGDRAPQDVVQVEHRDVVLPGPRRQDAVDLDRVRDAIGDARVRREVGHEGGVHELEDTDVTVSARDGREHGFGTGGADVGEQG